MAFRWILIVLLLASCKRDAQELSFAAAVSLRAALPEIGAAFEKEHPATHVVPLYGASGDLAKRVRDGAPIDAVAFAAPEPLDKLVADGLVDAGSRQVIAENRLVLIGPKGGRKLGWQTIDSLEPDDKLAIGDPDSVPAGAYAKKALVALGKWDALKGRLVLGGDVGAVLTYARRGEVAAAIVYVTEAQGVDDVVVLEEARGAWAPKAEVVAGVVKGPHAGPAASFVAYLASPPAQAIFRSHGFGP